MDFPYSSSITENTEALIPQQGFSEAYYSSITGVTSLLSVSWQRSEIVTTQFVLCE